MQLLYRKGIFLHPEFLKFKFLVRNMTRNSTFIKCVPLRDPDIFFPFMATPVTYGSSQARGQIGTAAEAYATAKATGSELHLQTTLQFAATPDP